MGSGEIVSGLQEDSSAVPANNSFVDNVKDSFLDLKKTLEEMQSKLTDDPQLFVLSTVSEVLDRISKFSDSLGTIGERTKLLIPLTAPLQFMLNMTKRLVSSILASNLVPNSFLLLVSFIDKLFVSFMLWIVNLFITILGV